MNYDDPRMAAMKELLTEYRDATVRANNENPNGNAIGDHRATIGAYFMSMYGELPEDQFLVDYIPKMIQKAIDETNNVAVMDKLMEDL